MKENFIKRQIIELHGVKTEVLSSEASETCFLFLHPERGLLGSEAFLAGLARYGHVVAPYHPGFRFDAPDHFRSIDDLSYFYLDLLAEMDLRNVSLVGSSLGGWLAMEIASKDSSRIADMTLLAPAGVKFAGRTERDMQDIFSLDPDAVDAFSFYDQERVPALHREDVEQLELAIRAREAAARYAWLPYMHNPQLGRRLHRLYPPTRILWGREDRISPPRVGEALAAKLPSGSFQSIEACGHYPHIECPDLVITDIVNWRAQHSWAAPKRTKGSK